MEFGGRPVIDSLRSHALSERVGSLLSFVHCDRLAVTPLRIAPPHDNAKRLAIIRDAPCEGNHDLAGLQILSFARSCIESSMDDAVVWPFQKSSRSPLNGNRVPQACCRAVCVCRFDRIEKVGTAALDDQHSRQRRRRLEECASCNVHAPSTLKWFADVG